MSGIRVDALAVLSDRSAGFVEEHLARRLGASGVSARDRALATEIVLGTVRRRGTLDAVIAAYSARPIEKIDPMVREAIRLGLYQILFLGRVPPHAAVGETVEAVKTLGRGNSAGFVNGVLRTVLRERSFAVGSARRVVTGGPRPVRLGRDVFPEPGSDLAGHLAARESHPRWLVERWLERFGEDRARRMFDAGNAPGGLTLLPLGVAGGELARRLVEAGYEATTSEDGAHVLVSGGGAVDEMPGFAEGRFLVQDRTQSEVVARLAPRSGETILDLCAAPGTKTGHIARLAPGALVYAVDIAPERLVRLGENERRLGLRNVRRVAADARRLPFEAGRVFDAALVDAPCSNTGVLSRRVEARWRVDAESIRGLSALQSELLEAAAGRIRPGGRLVYSTCSVEREENEEVVERVRAGRPDLELASSETKLQDGSSGGGFCAVLVRTGGG